MAMVEQHKVHCLVEKGPRASEPPLDLVQLLQMIESAKSLVPPTMMRLEPKE